MAKCKRGHEFQFPAYVGTDRSPFEWTHPVLDNAGNPMNARYLRPVCPTCGEKV